MVPDLSQLTAQQAKEAACRLAIKNGFGLMRRGEREMWRVYPDETTRFLCRSADAQIIWHSALETIRFENERAPKVNIPRPLKFAANVIHNCLIHPVMPFTWGRCASIADSLHDFTAKLAFDHDDV
jgi:hypothetical protein